MNSSFKKKNDLKKLKRTVNGKEYVILLNSEIGSWAVFSSEDIERYENSELCDEEMELLYLRGLALSESGEIVEMDFPKPAEYPSVIILNITTACNLKCEYCFADCSPTAGESMEYEVMEKTIQQVFSLPTSHVTFEFQGGEPLCNIQGIRNFLEIAEAQKTKCNKTVQYRTVTNCTMISDEFAQIAKDFKMKITISLDGPEQLNDKARVDAEGNGTFNRVIDGISKLRNNEICIDGAVCTIGQHNYNNAEDIVELFNELNIDFKPRPVNILGREKETNFTTKKGQWAKTFIKMHNLSDSAKVENFIIHIFEENVYTPVRDYVCLRYPCGAAREIISINPNGDVLPCDGFKAEGKFVLGNVKDDTIAEMLNQEWVLNLKNRTFKDIKKCNSCIYKAMCCSCCYSAFGKFGSIYREDPHCYDRRKIFEFLIDKWISNNCA